MIADSMVTPGSTTGSVSALGSGGSQDRMRLVVGRESHARLRQTGGPVQPVDASVSVHATRATADGESKAHRRNHAGYFADAAGFEPSFVDGSNLPGSSSVRAKMPASWDDAASGPSGILERLEHLAPQFARKVDDSRHAVVESKPEPVALHGLHFDDPGDQGFLLQQIFVNAAWVGVARHSSTSRPFHESHISIPRRHRLAGVVGIRRDGDAGDGR